MKLIKIKLALLILSASTLTYGQTFEEAKANFENKNYLKAKEQFGKLLKVKSKDPLLNQYYVICQAEVAYANYQFDESVLLLKKCVDDPKTDTKLKTLAEQRLSYTTVAARQIRGVEKVQIIDSMVVDKQNFMKAYQLSNEAGSVINSDKFFGTSTGNFASVYQNQRKDKIYFAEKSNGNNYQLYTQNRLLDSWSEKTPLPDAINTKANENFPYVLTDGTTLYFASDGEGSIGGYDIFITRYNLAGNSYLAPENVGMPFNSIYNDYMMAIDEQNNIGWFASDRYQPEGKVIIYLFIPNESKQVYENESPDKLTHLAQLRSIKETWKKGASYQSLLDKIRNIDRSSDSQTNSKGAFRLVINDNQVYHSWSDFKNEEAKAAYQEYIQTGNKLLTQKDQLKKLREEYISPEQSHREEVSNVILSLEKEVEELQTRQAELKLKAINLENQNLR